MNEILIERTGSVAWVTLNRPSAGNSLSRAVNLELTELFLQLENEPEILAIAVTGAGESVFCAGADLKERRDVASSDAGPYIDAIAGVMEVLANVRKPTLAVVNGAAIGGGAELALACDFRIAAQESYFQLREVQIGIMPGAGGTQRLPRLIGMAAAKEMVLLGRRVNADRALALGLVMEVAPRAELRSLADKVLAELALCAPLAVMQAKRALEEGIELPMREALRLERRCYDVTLYSEDRDEGLLAFAEKRPPRFRGM